VSGNVSLYNETNGRAILPTPTIGAVGVLPDGALAATLAFKRAGEEILLVGETTGWLGQSVFLRELHGREEGAPPPVRCEVEKRNGDFVRALIRNRRVTACHDCSDGGLLVAVAEMAMASGLGARLDARPHGAPLHAAFFGEDQARYVVTASAEEVGDILEDAFAAGVPCVRIGTTGGEALTILDEPPLSVARLRERHEGWFPAFMAGPRAAAA
jgi:phosphoribosylformylglycinamidine synthase